MARGLTIEQTYRLQETGGGDWRKKGGKLGREEEELGLLFHFH
jgi:hypothetical protein